MASYVEWQKSFSVGNTELDTQHKAMFELLSGLYDGLEQGQSPRPIEEMIEEACRYAEQHFAREEFLMADCGYPQLRKHQQKHQEYLDHVVQLRRKTMESQDVTLEFFLFLKGWWLNHIAQMDLAYAPYLAREVSRGPEETAD